jgi:c(7)-type cytochrome triheme protein
MGRAEAASETVVWFTSRKGPSIQAGVSRAAVIAAVGFGFVGLVAHNLGAAPPKDVAADLTKAFSHANHLKQAKGDGTYTCDDCHALPKSEGGTYPICESARMPFPNHDKCIGCHASAFFKPPIVICTNCHTSVAITEKSPLKEQSGNQAPLRTVFSHKSHLDPKEKVRKRFEERKDCGFCHQMLKGGEAVSLPSHPQCCECHTKEDVTPTINDCAACHKRKKSDRNPESMVKKFTHTKHLEDTKTKERIACVKCHFDVPKATTVHELQLPKMATCVECHQGEIAFSYAECLRCHDKGIESKLVPKTHKL